MARYTGPSCRLCRRENTELFLKGDRCYTDKCAIKRRNYPPGQHGPNKRRGKKLKDRSALQQQFAELELNALQSQMNPHFVFNAMGSLQNLVQNNQ